MLLHHWKGSSVLIVPMASAAMVRTVQISTTVWATRADMATARTRDQTCMSASATRGTTLASRMGTCQHAKRFCAVLPVWMGRATRVLAASTKDSVTRAALAMSCRPEKVGRTDLSDLSSTLALTFCVSIYSSRKLHVTCCDWTHSRVPCRPSRSR